MQKDFTSELSQPVLDAIKKHQTNLDNLLNQLKKQVSKTNLFEFKRNIQNQLEIFINQWNEKLRSERDQDRLMNALSADSTAIHLMQILTINQQIQATNYFEDELQKHQQLTQILVHELKNSISTIFSMVQANEKEFKGSEDDPIRADCFRIQGICNNVLGLLENVYSLSMIEQEMLTVEAKILDLVTDVLQPIEDELQFKLSEKNMRVDISYKETFYVMADVQLMQVVFRNLLTNAYQYGESDSIISIQLKKKKGNIQISVKNETDPPKMDNLDQLFQKYYRGQQKITNENMGLGLYTVRKIIDKHGGNISVKTDGIQWIKFIVTLPLND
ncbi:MAG: GHKL domain-containing protein [Caldithrix sp.]|nr:GHKL domain-containing protein [Caldithrix sp.]